MASVSHQAAELKRRKRKLGEDEEEVDRKLEVGHFFCMKGESS